MCIGRNDSLSSYIAVTQNGKQTYPDILDAIDRSKEQPGPFIVLREHDGALVASRGKAREFGSLFELAKAVPDEDDLTQLVEAAEHVEQLTKSKKPIHRVNKR